jgi:hypothetical protein
VRTEHYLESTLNLSQLQVVVGYLTNLRHQFKLTSLELALNHQAQIFSIRAVLQIHFCQSMHLLMLLLQPPPYLVSKVHFLLLVNLLRPQILSIIHLNKVLKDYSAIIIPVRLHLPQQLQEVFSLLILLPRHLVKILVLSSEDSFNHNNSRILTNL